MSRASALRPPSVISRAAVLAGVAVASLSGCISSLTDSEVRDLGGEWCTFRSLGSDGLPLPSVSFVGMTLIREGSTVLGSGTTKRAADTVIWYSRYRGDVTGDQVVMQVSDLDAGLEEPGPAFTMDLQLEGNGDLLGTASGDTGFNGPIRLVRLSARCFQ